MKYQYPDLGQVDIKEQTLEYFIEVKAEEVPSKAELVSALESLEESNDPNYDPNYDPDDPNYDPNEEIISENNCETSTTTFENDTKIVVKLQDQKAVARLASLTTLDLKNSELDEVNSIEIST